MSGAAAHRAIFGIVAQMITPFAADASINVKLLRRLLERMIDAGVDAIAPIGDSGESIYLDRIEWRRATATCLEQIAGRVPTIVDVSDITTAGTIERARFAERLSATAIMIRPISCALLNVNELRQHFAMVAEFVNVPIMIGNDPSATGVDMIPEFVADLAAEIELITMIKESSGLIERMKRITELSGGAVSPFNGSNLHALHAYRVGVAGWCTAATCLVPEKIVQLWRLLESEEVVGGTKLFAELAPLLAAIADFGAPATIKSGLRTLGIDAGDPRLPQLPLDRHVSAELAELLSVVRLTTRTTAPVPSHFRAQSMALTSTRVCSRSLRR
ncbi:dihydrodipicolinate synthase family protein [Nocardia gipuzkoensis]|uniref:dihydrodipicolinate synthase family protein n=1 Tax=Nocardia gipuzkoensis TaxID=2749991 RepID=UPI00237E42A6|nr:dihydrodipicolinate synthase family protein [Nocardia gipuzkoensis]MDE1675481.1 dihydrodipicolinate synthase family protein [Nocardia gipuzkoensis]